jgi:hypothetical protein
MAKHLDVYANDAYPHWFRPEGVDTECAFYAQIASLCRGMKNGRPYLLMESAPGIKDPEMIRRFIRAARATDLTLPLPARGERSDRSCDPGEGESRRSQLSTNLPREPLTPTLSPQGRGEGEEVAPLNDMKN